MPMQGAGEEMVELGLPKVVATRSLQSWGDDDMPELLIWLDEELCDHIQVSPFVFFFFLLPALPVQADVMTPGACKP
jgi:hypothetical protein